MKKLNLFVIVRVLIGAVFLVSGFEKVTHPYQNFLYVIEHYELFSEAFGTLIAVTLPWFELFVGLFLIVGLWITVVLKASAALFLSFILIVLQAIVRHLPVGECGCFGELIHLPLEAVFLMDSVFLVLTALMIKNKDKVLTLSLDKAFESKG